MEKKGYNQEEFEIKYPKPTFGFIFPLKIFDDLEVAVRTTIAVLCGAAVCLYEDNEKVIDEFPLCFLMIVIAFAISLVPFSGAILSHGMSFMWGAFLATLAVIVVIEILGSDYDTVVVTVPAGISTCIYSPNPIIVPPGSILPVIIPIQPFSPTPVMVDLDGSESDPSPYLLGFFILLGTFLFIYAGESKFFILGSCIVFDFYLATWYSATQTPLRPIPESDDFFKFTRTMLIGWGFIMGAFLLPLPRLIPTFIPQPRFASTMIFSQLGRSAKILSCNFNDIIELYKALQKFGNQYEVRAFTKARIELLDKTIDEMLDLMRTLLKLVKFAAQYEILWLPLPFPHFTTVSRITETINAYRGICLFQRAMIRAIQSYVKYHKNKPFEVPGEFENFLDEFNVEVSKFGNFHILGNPLFCKYDDIQGRWDEFSEKFSEMAKDHFGNVDFHISSSKPSKMVSIGFHSYFLYCMRGLCDNIIRVEKLRRLPENRILGILLVIIDWPLHMLGWFLQYFFIIFATFKEFLFTLQRRKSYTFFKFFRRHYARIFGSALAAISAFLAFLFVLIDDWRERLPTATTVIIMAVVLVDREQPSGGIQNGILRLAGTTLGVAVAFCIVIFFDDTPEDGLDDDIVFIYTACFTLLSRFIMQNQRYLFFAYTFFVTNIFLFYFQSVDFATFIGLIGLRAVAIGIGIAIATVVMSLWPVRAPLRLRRSYAEAVTISKDLIDETLCLDETTTSSTQKLSLLQKKTERQFKDLTKLIFEQKSLREAAEYEPDIITSSFPASDYYKVYEAELLLITDCVIVSQILLMMYRHNARSDNVSYENIVESEWKDRLIASFKLLQNRCLIVNAAVHDSQVELFDLKSSFVSNLIEFDELAQKSPPEILGITAINFALFNTILSLENLNETVTFLEAHKVAMQAPGIPLIVPPVIFQRFLDSPFLN